MREPYPGDVLGSIPENYFHGMRGNEWKMFSSRRNDLLLCYQFYTRRHRFMLHFLWDMNNKKWYNGFYIKFRQIFAKDTFSYDEYLRN